MLLSRDFRKIARENLQGRWFSAIVVCFIGGLLGASMDISFSADLFTRTGSTSEYNSVVDQLQTADVYETVLPVLMGIGITVLVMVLIHLVIGVAVTLGYAQYFLNVTDDNEPEFGNLFSHMRLWEGFCMQFFRGMMVMLWSILFVIPGYIALYRYAMTPYIMAENENLSVMEAITESKRIMMGNKWRLFCMDVSFIGWELLGILTLGIGFFWITPYEEAAKAAFYREITEQRYSNPAVNSHPINEDVRPEWQPYETVDVPESSEEDTESVESDSEQGFDSDDFAE